MTRKDSEKDSERPHYYSQFWLDIAAGRRTIGGPKPEDGEALENETAEPVLQRRPGRGNEPETFHSTPPLTNGYREEVIHPAVDEEVIQPSEDEEYDEPEEDLTQDNDELNEGDYQEDLPLEDEELPDMDLSSEEEENTGEENELLDDEDDDMNWGGRGRKKAKPTRPTKAPIKKSGKPRRSGGY